MRLCETVGYVGQTDKQMLNGAMERFFLKALVIAGIILSHPQTHFSLQFKLIYEKIV